MGPGQVGIRMEDSNIGEVRGVAQEQNLDPYMGDVVRAKLKEFPDGESYQKKIADMKRLTDVDKKHKAHEAISKDDLRFLYELDSKIEGFGYQTDPRIKELLDTRDMKADLSELTGYSQEHISTTQKEALKGGIKFHYGYLDLGSLEFAEGLQLPETLRGNLDLSRLESAEKQKIKEEHPNLYII